MAIITRTELKQFIYERYQYHKKKLAELAEETTPPEASPKKQYITIPKWMIEQEPKP